jgi:hypothetical protein
MLESCTYVIAKLFMGVSVVLYSCPSTLFLCLALLPLKIVETYSIMQKSNSGDGDSIFIGQITSLGEISLKTQHRICMWKIIAADLTSFVGSL